MADKHHVAKDVAKGTAEEAEALHGQFQKLTESVKKCSSKGAEAVARVVETHPLKSVGISAGCGLLIGFLLAKK